MTFGKQSVLDRVHQELRWPVATEIFQPSGAGPSMLAELVQRKLQNPLSQMVDGLDPKVGILSREPLSDATDLPLAVVCDFPAPVSNQIIREAHRLSWNFSYAPVLITLEPYQIRAWSCYESPMADSSDENLSFEIPEIRTDLIEHVPLAEQAASSLHWLELITGRFFEKHQDRFQRDNCADRLLLNNLKEVRRILIEDQKLDEDVCHDLLARIIFIQFLIDRKDSSGKSALSQAKFAALFRQGTLSKPYTHLDDILSNYNDTYALFQWLNEHFNGDLFPGSGQNKKRQKEEWASEKSMVNEDHLFTLADFIGGRLDFQNRQGLLWRRYSFDVIPLEFISSIYEEFVTRKDKKKKRKTGTFYTPPHLVDFILDGVLPWRGTEWDLKILDPACGSGIFLVKAFQRLIWRWKSLKKQKPSATILKRLLTQNLFGVDRDEHAVRVASFSLYLAMCDEIDPKYYWSNVQFPALRGCTLIASDFFRENISGFRAEEDAETYDIIVGNPPWGRNTIRNSDVSKWEDQGWEVADKNIGPLFLPKTAALSKKEGIVSMLQPSGLLTNNMGTAIRFRQKFFLLYKIQQIVNLSTLRFGLYKGAIGPSCIVTYITESPNGEPFPYLAPKEMKTIDDDLRIVIEPNDVQLIYQDDAAFDSVVWSTLTWGGPRELALIRRLAGNRTLYSFLHDKKIIKRRGIVRSDRGREDGEILDRRILESKEFPKETFLYLNANQLPINNDPCVHSKDSTDYSAFNLPQLIIKQGWKVSSKRFEAAVVKAHQEGILCSQSYTSIHLKQGSKEILETACLVMNSRFATFYLTLTSGQMATYIPKVAVEDLLSLPLPKIRSNQLEGLLDYDELDVRVKGAFGFSDSEWTLIDDLFNYTLPDFKGDANSPGRLRTRFIRASDGDNDAEKFLKNYCEYFFRVLKAGFGSDKCISATIFSESDDSTLPVRLLAFHLDDVKDGDISIESYTCTELRDQLLKWDELLTASPSGASKGALHQRVAKIYNVIDRERKRVPTVYLIKPDRRRYWTRSIAMRDADSIAADIMMWQADSGRP